MKKLKHLFTALLLLCCVGTATAHRFEVDGIYYNISSSANKAVEVTCRGNYYYSYDNEYTGSVVIPESVTYNGTTYSVTSIGDEAFRDCTGLTSITTPNSVTSIEYYAFYGCTGLTSITIPNSVTSIGNGAFSRCTGLTSIEIPNNVTNIGNGAFYECEGLTSVVIGNSVTSIGEGAFQDCSGLTSIEIPNSVTSIGNAAFFLCTGLISIIVDDNNTKYDSRENCNAIIETETNTLVSGCKNTIIPNSVTNIGNYTFYGCTGLTSITIPNSVTSIGYEAFRGCSGLTSVVIGNSVTSIGEKAFYYCQGLTSIEIPNSVTSIGNNAFYNCKGITSIVIGNSVTSIGDFAFKGCTGLTSITIPNSVTSIGDDAFEICTGLTSVVIGNSVTSIGRAAFFKCKGITSITIPNSVTSIGESAFYECSGLTNVTIGSSVTFIGSSAFAKCDNLTDVYCLATSVPSTVPTAFYESYPEYMTLHVPAEAIESYKTAEPWSSFGTIVTLGGETPEIPETPKCANPVITYTNGKLSLECATEDAEFITDVTCSDIKKFYDSEIVFSATYNISVYATATGYDNSDIVNATLCWIECIENGDDNTTEIIEIPAKAVLITSNNGVLHISCQLDGEEVAVYTTAGTLIATTTIENGTATVATGLSKGSVAIVNIAGKSIKIAVD